MTALSLPFACECGQVHGTLHDLAPKSGNQVTCHCTHCRGTYKWLGHDDPAPDGVRYYQTTPDRIEFGAGLDTLKAITWKNPRLLRWYAPCCNSTLFNTLDSPKWAFASLDTARIEDPDVLGPVKAYAFKPLENGKTETKGFRYFMIGFMRRMIKGRLTGSWRTTPFFDDRGTPVGPVQNLTQEDRA